MLNPETFLWNAFAHGKRLTKYRKNYIETCVVRPADMQQPLQLHIIDVHLFVLMLLCSYLISVYFDSSRVTQCLL